MRTTRTNYAKFSPGTIEVTPMVAEKLSVEEVCFALARHVEGDWGSVDEHDQKQNELALKHRLISKHVSHNGLEFWIITEADRSSTTVQLLSDD